VPLALQIVGQPSDKDVDVSFPRDSLLAVAKILAEAKASERKIFTGLVVNVGTESLHRLAPIRQAPCLGQQS
jgi:hypothetical protein